MRELERKRKKERKKKAERGSREEEEGTKEQRYKGSSLLGLTLGNPLLLINIGTSIFPSTVFSCVQVHDHVLSREDTKQLSHQQMLNELKEALAKPQSFGTENEKVILWKSREVDEAMSLRSNSFQGEEDDTSTTS